MWVSPNDKPPIWGRFMMFIPSIYCDSGDDLFYHYWVHHIQGSQTCSSWIEGAWTWYNQCQSPVPRKSQLRLLPRLPPHFPHPGSTGKSQWWDHQKRGLGCCTFPQLLRQTTRPRCCVNQLLQQALVQASASIYTNESVRLRLTPLVLHKLTSSKTTLYKTKFTPTNFYTKMHQLLFAQTSSYTK